MTEPLVIDSVILDCDGVLFDSSAANIAFFNAVLRTAGLPPLSAEWEHHATVLAASQLLDTLLAADPEARARCHAVARALDYGPFYDLMRPVPGLYAVLARLRRTYRLAMASNRGRTAREVVHRFGLAPYLACVVSALDVPRPKPAPDMLLACAGRLGSSPAASLYVGDAETDRAAAAAAGMPFVAVGDACDAPLRIATLTELPPLLERLAGRPRC